MPIHMDKYSPVTMGESLNEFRCLRGCSDRIHHGSIEGGKAARYLMAQSIPIQEKNETDDFWRFISQREIACGIGSGRRA